MVIRTDTGHTSSFHALNELIQIDQTISISITPAHDLIYLPAVKPYPIIFLNYHTCTFQHGFQLMPIYLPIMIHIHHLKYSLQIFPPEQATLLNRKS